MIAAMLLCKRNWSSVEIANIDNRLCCEGFVLDGFNDDLSCLVPLIEISFQCDISLEKSLTYQSLLADGITVKSFLEQHANKQVLDFLLQDKEYSSGYYEQFGSVLDKEVVVGEKVVSKVCYEGPLKRLKKRFNRVSGVSFLR